MRAATLVLAGALAGALVAGTVCAEPIYGFSRAAAGTGFAESFEGALERSGTAGAPAIRIEDVDLGGEAGEPPSPTVQRPRYGWIALGSALVVAGSYYDAYKDYPHFPFHFTSEGWLGQNTYAGGGDKASHFVSYYVVGRLMSVWNEAFGMREDSALLLGAGVAALGGLATELGDGINRYGFSFEDLTMDTLGAATSLAIAHYRLDDLIGFRGGLVPTPEAPRFGLGKDYSAEIYTADLKIGGLGQRAHFNPGPARFLLFSVSYSAKGYPYAPPQNRDRQVGFEIGINFNEILRAACVPPEKWWGKALYLFFDVIRIPYTQIGMYYGLNSGHWYGPGIGDEWPGYGAAPAGARARR